jgi:3-oxocholest-4-en-26-oate---CoA ligase
MVQHGSAAEHAPGQRFCTAPVQCGAVPDTPSPTSPAQTAVQFNLAKAFDVLVETLADRECIVWRDRRLSYGDVSDRSKRLAAYLHAKGLGVHRERDELASWESGQDHLALALYNGNEYLEGMLGSYGARVAPFNVNYRYVGEELRYLLNDARPRAMILHSSLAPTLAEVLPTLDAPPDVLLQVEDEPGHGLLPGAVWYEEALAASSPAGAPVDPSPDDLYVLYTGGTTGMPKGVLWRQHDIFMAAMGGRKVGTWEIVTSYEDLTTRLDESIPLRLMVLPPLMHGAAQWACFMLMAQGATLLFPDDTHRVDPDDVWTVVEREKANTMTIVGDAVLRPLLMQLDKKTYDLSSFYAVGNGGAPLTPAVRALAVERIPNLVISDSAGSSETGAQMHVTSVDDVEVGTFLPGPGTVVTDETFTRVLEPGHEGNGWLAQTGSVPLGYLGDEAKTARTFPVIDGVRYSIPGDRARHLANGEIQLLGRDSVTVNSGGEKIFVEEVERAIAGHPAVADVVVIGRPSERWGSEVVAVVQLAEGAESDAEQQASIVEEASSHIARYKLPKDVVFVEQIQRSPSGKADYRWAAETAVKAQGA